jgi:DNA-binding XRE family transcriptional regulator
MDVKGRTDLLKRERATRGLTLRAAASQAQISPETLRRIEQGRNARLPAAIAVARLYERELEELFEFGELTVQEQVMAALIAAADPDQLRSAAFALSFQAHQSAPAGERDAHPLMKLAEQLELAAESKPRRGGVKWELTTAEADTLLDAAAFAARNADGDMAARANELIREFRPSQYIDGKEKQ